MMMLRRVTALRRLAPVQGRVFHASAALSADALDMVDTFARRHSKLDGTRSHVPPLGFVYAYVMTSSCTCRS